MTRLRSTRTSTEAQIVAAASASGAHRSQRSQARRVACSLRQVSTAAHAPQAITNATGSAAVTTVSSTVPAVATATTAASAAATTTAARGRRDSPATLARVHEAARTTPFSRLVTAIQASATTIRPTTASPIRFPHPAGFAAATSAAMRPMPTSRPIRLLRSLVRKAVSQARTPGRAACLARTAARSARIPACCSARRSCSAGSANRYPGPSTCRAPLTVASVSSRPKHTRSRHWAQSTSSVSFTSEYPLPNNPKNSPAPSTSGTIAPSHHPKPPPPNAAPSSPTAAVPSIQARLSPAVLRRSAR